MNCADIYYIGLMSGTSLDGIDGVLARFTGGNIEVLQQAGVDYPDSLQEALLALFLPADNEIERIEQACQQRNHLALNVIEQLCTGIDRNAVVAIADHGQTIRHFPNADPAYTLQIHRAAELAELSGIDCVVDFRSKDIAAGGQGAPLVPAFHQAYFSDAHRHRVVVNIGGLANISLLPRGTENTSIGFDTGPGNTLLDTWCQQHTGTPYDIDGQWAAGGQVNQALLSDLMADEYFHKAPPKSTGREYFNPAWLQNKLTKSDYRSLDAADIQASLTALTAHSIALGIRQACELSGIKTDSTLQGVYVCGGGACNQFLMQQLASQISVPVKSSSELGIPPKLVEATAFAWLGKQAVDCQAVDLRRTTGARHSTILGALYRA
ncbi:MAG: anhydro-N-acetylmuramic acid kinase [Proteobacteria bacterium]|nr:anhydro-N-acetylmuramic acid kinase [Pseudomonadota bacterium]